MGAMRKKFDFDIAIIGGGAAGIAAAQAAARLKKKVALIECDKIGGNSVNGYDIPCGAAMHFADLFADSVYGARFGLSSKNLRYNYPTALHWYGKAVAKAYGTCKKKIDESNITCFHGRAHFIGSHELSISKNNNITAKKILIATGSKPKSDGIAGLAAVPHLTPSTAFKISKVPKTVMVIGGGASGVEVAEYFAELGSKVAIAEISSRLLPREDEEVAQVLEQYFDKRFGMKILTQTRVVALERDAASNKVIFMRGGKECMVRVEAVVVATGSQPALDLGLENADVKFDQTGIQVTRTLQTSAKHVFVAGDALGNHDSSTERAVYEAGIAIKNMFGKNSNYVNYNGFVRTVNTNPQVAVTGLTEDDLVKSAKKYKSVIVPLSVCEASNIHDFRMGFVKMLADKDGKLLGATIVAPNATEIIQEVSVMLRHGFSAIELASTPHVATSWSELVRMAARELVGKH